MRRLIEQPSHHVLTARGGSIREDRAANA